MPVTAARQRHADPADAAAFQVVRDVCRRHAKEYFFASGFLPKPKRDAVYAVYAFCRMIREALDVDDASVEGAAGLRHHPAVVSPAAFEPGTGCASGSPLQARLGMLRDRLDEIYDDRLELPRPESRSEAQHTLHALGLAVRRHEIPRQLFLDFAEGCRADLAVARYATWKSLEKHRFYTAGVVGLMVACVLGLTHSGAGGQAVEMGMAMRFTSILRDLKADWKRGRVYLPLEDVVKFRYTERDLAAGVVNDNFRELMRFEVARARKMYRQAAEGVCWLAGDGARLAASAVTVLHAGTLAAIERKGYECSRGRCASPRGRSSASWPRRPASLGGRGGRRCRTCFPSTPSDAPERYARPPPLRHARRPRRLAPRDRARRVRAVVLRRGGRVARRPHHPGVR